ncbi:unnamed protein product, partial [Scytosiphon promiscuus]
QEVRSSLLNSRPVPLSDPNTIIRSDAGPERERGADGHASEQQRMEVFALAEAMASTVANNDCGKEQQHHIISRQERRSHDTSRPCAPARRSTWPGQKTAKRH